MFREAVPKRGHEVRGGRSLPIDRVSPAEAYEVKSGNGAQMQDLSAENGSARPWTDEHLFATDEGVFTTRTVKRVPDTEQREGDLVKNGQGTPWDRLARRPVRRHLFKQRLPKPQQASDRVLKRKSEAARRRKIKHLQWSLTFWTHSVSHAHFSDTFSLRCEQTSRTRMAQGVCSAHVAPLPSHLLPSHVSSAVFAVPARSPRHFVPVCTFLAELFPIRKCGSSALPHERRGVWLPGRSDALHE